MIKNRWVNDRFVFMIFVIGLIIDVYLSLLPFVNIYIEKVIATYKDAGIQTFK